MNSLKTVLLMGILFGIFMLIGGLVGGQSGIVIAFMIALIMNGITYWFSDQIVLAMYRAKELDQSQAPRLHDIVTRLAVAAHLEELHCPRPTMGLRTRRNPMPTRSRSTGSPGRDHR